MISGPWLDTLKDSGKHPCYLCRKGDANQVIPSAVLAVPIEFTRDVLTLKAN